MIPVFWRQISSSYSNCMTFKFKVKYKWGGQNVVFSIKQLVSVKRWVIRRELLGYRPLVSSSMILIPWMAFKGHCSLCCHSHVRYLGNYVIRPQKLKLLIRNHTTVFRWYDCRQPWQYFKVIRLFHILFLVNGAWCGKSYYGLLHCVSKKPDPYDMFK